MSGARVEKLADQEAIQYYHQIEKMLLETLTNLQDRIVYLEDSKTRKLIDSQLNLNNFIATISAVSKFYEFPSSKTKREVELAARVLSSHQQYYQVCLDMKDLAQEYLHPNGIYLTAAREQLRQASSSLTMYIMNKQHSEQVAAELKEPEGTAVNLQQVSPFMATP